jgi:FkbM family methyltransferase
VAFALNRLVNVEDFAEPTVRDAIREVFEHEVARTPGFPSGREHRKHWEAAMGVLALREGGALQPDAQVLFIGPHRETTLFWLTNHVGRVWALDIGEPTARIQSDASTMPVGPGPGWPGQWNPRRLVVQHMDACELAFEDDTFDAIIFSGSMTPVGSLERVQRAMDEAWRVLKPGGTLSISTDFLLIGEKADQSTMFTRDSIERILVGERDWAPVVPMDFTLSEVTKQTEVDYDSIRLERESDTVTDGEARLDASDEASVYPYCVLRVGPVVFTSVHLALRKADPMSEPVVASPAGAELVVAGPREDVTALTRHLDDRVVVIDAGCRWGFGPQWEALGEHVKLIGFDPDGEECSRLEERYAGRPLDTTFVPVALGSESGRSAFRHFAEPAVGSLYAHDPRWLFSMALPREGDTLQEVADVDLETMDEWCAEHAVEHVDALKLDVQGHELEILRGAPVSLANVRTIEAEVWLNPVVTGAPMHGEIDAFLREHGFCLWRLDDQTHYPVVDGEGAPGSLQHIDPYGHGQIEVHLPSGILSWANAHYVRKEIFEVGVRLPWDVRLRDAVLMNALSFHDLTLISLRRLLEEDPPEAVAEDVRAVLATLPQHFGPAVSGPGEDDDVTVSSPTEVPPVPAPVVQPSRRRSLLHLLRAAVRLPYHPIVWRLERNAIHGQRHAAALETHLARIERQLEVMSALLDDVRIRQEQEDAASRVVARELRQIRSSQDEIHRATRETVTVNELSQEAIVEWSALISRAIGEDRDDHKAGRAD